MSTIVLTTIALTKIVLESTVPTKTVQMTKIQVSWSAAGPGLADLLFVALKRHENQLPRNRAGEAFGRDCPSWNVRSTRAVTLRARGLNKLAAGTWPASRLLLLDSSWMHFLHNRVAGQSVERWPLSRRHPRRPITLLVRRIVIAQSSYAAGATLYFFNT